MSLVKVEIAFGEDPFDSTRLDAGPGTNWTDVSADVRSATYRTSTRSDRFAVFSAGNAQIELDNSARLYDPGYAAGTHFGDFKRNTPVRITGVHSSTDYVQWYGYAKSWVPSYTMPTDSVTVLSAVDGLGLLAQYDVAPITEAYKNDTAGVRIGRVLDDFGFPSPYRDLEAGPQLQATAFGANALAHCMLAARSAGGEFYAQRDGTLTFDSHDALSTTRQATAQDVIGHDAAPTPLADGSLRMTGVGLGYRDKVTIGMSGGSAVTIDNSAANEAPVTFQQTNLIHKTAHQSSALAAFFADLYGTEVPHPASIRMVALTVNESVNTVLFQRKVRDRVTVELGPPGGGADISHDCFIDGISGTIQNGIWLISYTLSSADAYDDNLVSAPSTWLLLNDATYGELEAYTLGY